MPGSTSPSTGRATDGTGTWYGHPVVMSCRSGVRSTSAAQSISVPSTSPLESLYERAFGGVSRRGRRPASSRLVLLHGPFGDAPRALLFGKVLDPGHNRPPYAELVPDAGEPVAGNERGRCFANDGTGRLGPGNHGVDVRTVEADGVTVLIPFGRRDEPVVRHRLPKLQQS